MNYKIITDSSSDLLKLDGVCLDSVPLKIITDEREYVDDESLDVIGMLNDLRQYKGRSHSSCPNSEEYIRAFGDAENVFCITITSGLSGSCNAAKKAAADYVAAHPDRRVHVIDSLSTGPESALIIEEIARLISEGCDFDEVVEKISEYHNHTRLIFALESMHNLANNGRVSHLVAKMAGILGIRAIGRASDIGTLEMTNKSRGMQNMVADIVKNMLSEGCEGGRIRIHHADNEPAAMLLGDKISEKLPAAEIVVDRAGGLCSFYAERGGLLVGFTVK